jgi:hypothetical protein
MQAEEFSAYLVTHLDWVFEDDLPKHDKLFKSILPMVSGGEWKEEGIVLSGFGAMPAKNVGGAITVDKFYTSSQKTFTTQTWGLGCVLEYELVRHDQYNIWGGDLSRELAKSAVDRCNILAYGMFNNAFSTSDSRYTIYNAEALCSTSHTLLSGGTLSNQVASNPALSYTALQTGRTMFLKMKNERGIYVRLMPECLVVDPSIEWYAQTLMQSSLRPGTANNDKNVLPKYKVHGESPYLTSTTAWFLLAAKSVLKRRSCRFRELDKPGTRSDFDASTWNTVYTCYTANRFETLHYQGVVGSDGTGS